MPFVVRIVAQSAVQLRVQSALHLAA